MKSNVKKRYAEQQIVNARIVRSGVLNYNPIPGDHTCAECVKRSGCQDICRKYGMTRNGFGTESSTHCMFEPQIFEPFEPQK